MTPCELELKTCTLQLGLPGCLLQTGDVVSSPASYPCLLKACQPGEDKAATRLSQGFMSSGPWGTLGHLLKTPSSQVMVTVQRPVVNPNKTKTCWLLAVTVLAMLSAFPDLADLSAAVSTWSDDKEACSHISVAAIPYHAAGEL